jgi:Fic family protein
MPGPGHYVPLGDGVAFLPAPLPPALVSTWEVFRAADQAHGAVREAVGQARLIANVELVARALARREAVRSSSMEGTQTEVVEVLVHEALAVPPPAEDSDLHEVLNYLATINLAADWIDEGRDFGVPLVRDLHRRLLQGVRGEDKAPGEFRRRNVYIGRRVGFQGARFIPPPLEHVPALMDNLVTFMADDDLYGPVVSAAIAHFQFEAIHPFEDGNGRIGRLLIPIQLLVNGVIDRPILYLAAALERRDAEYREALLGVSRDGDWNRWIILFAEAVQETAEDASRRVTGLMDLLNEYRSRVRSGSTSRYALPGIDVVFRRVFITAPMLARETGAKDPTARALIDDFVRLGILNVYGRVANTQTWVANEVLEKVYGD